MKKTEFAFLQGAENRLSAIGAGKHDDYELPEFTKEVPTGSRRKENGQTVSIEYDWKNANSEHLRVKRIDFRSSEDLQDFYRVGARDGADSITIRHNNTTYILRRTVREIAQALYNAYGKIKGALENIVGFLRTALGNDYVISKVEHEAWAFDKRIAKRGINYVEVDSLERGSKSRLVEMITEKIAELHSCNLIIGRFTLNNVLLNKEDIIFTDLRKLRVSRRRAYVIDEFKAVLQYLFAIGLATKEDVYASIAYYTAQNEDGCREWYSEKTGSKPSDTLDVAGRIEEEVYN